MCVTGSPSGSVTVPEMGIAEPSAPEAFATVTTGGELTLIANKA